MYSTDTQAQTEIMKKADSLAAEIDKLERAARRATRHTEVHELAAQAQTLRKQKRALMIEYYAIEDNK